MKILINSLVLFGGIIGQTIARSVKFSVISFGNDVKLNIGGNLTPMAKSDPTIPLWSATVDVPDSDINYFYVQDLQNDVQRTLKAGATTTYNELIGREITEYDMVEFTYPDEPAWGRSIGKTKLFDDSYIPTFIISGYGNFFVEGVGSTTFSRVIVILKDEVFSFNNIPTSGKNDDEDKFQFKITLPEDGIYNRNVLKFRPSSYDPVFFRQILYGDILHAIGNPAHESVTCRVYLDNGVGIGLYVLQEDCTTESFIRSAFYGDPSTGTIKPYTPSVIYDCSTGADFNVNDPNWLGSFQNNTYDIKAELLEMTRQLDILDVNNEEEVKSFSENWLDLDTLFKALALEYLAGHWDSYWFLTTNFVTYHPSEETEGGTGYYSKYKYYFIDQDFDQTWGVGMAQQLDPSTFPTRSYKDFVGLDWANLNPDEEFDSDTRVVIDKLIGCGVADKNANCYSKSLFEKHLKKIVRYIFNPTALGNKIDAYKDRLRPEIIWDTEEITRLHAGKIQKFHFNINDFDNNINSGNYQGSVNPWGLKDWVATRADVVCNEFNIDFNEASLTDSNGNTVITTSDGIKITPNIVSKFIYLLITTFALLYIF
ncbi:hypothetical protein H8356DRAFT_1026826 [Neocallimastix lanati (nom. inval.)]|jgi:hypothetical protein|uniref:Coth-domain-containing protein n=1 Tax=Neocallimastix californiae TaxID=1754190 RepID=A0A1Y2AC22_9FUNG|nr:hypothetical protein H8356DRAFT_1026826 [Neocallimastix sp. JGI-2020a]ORY20109.1 hypothetical protein LY90DRAFT_676946 [Neocallimastix californiae]|eukprot:ORY20109.1 hypothetical protein LY90DRAFT_676946 [Neocallimastix californiae]